MNSSPFLTAREVQAAIGGTLSLPSIHNCAGGLPAPVRVGDRAVRWYRSEIEQWLANLPRVVPAGDARGTVRVVAARSAQ